MDWFEQYEKESTESRMHTCPVCGKKFLPAPEHAWKIGYESEAERNQNLVCTYSCMRKWEKEREKGLGSKKYHRKRPGPKRPVIATHVETGKETCYDSLASASKGTGVSAYYILGIIAGKYEVSKNGYIFRDSDDHVQNVTYAFNRKPTPVIAINIDTGEKTYFKSIHSASRELGVAAGNISNVIRGIANRAGIYTFKLAK